MKFAKLASALVSTLALGACSTTAPVAQTAKMPAPVVAQITQFPDSAVNEAASAYVSLYKQTVEQSLAEKKYKSDLAFKHLSAEACLESRASRLLAKTLSREEKMAMVLSVLPMKKMSDYETLSQGHFARVNGLEMFSCDHAGLTVAQNTPRY